MKKLPILLMVLVLISCSPSEKGTIYWVNSYKVDCVGVGPMKCLQVQKAEQMNETSWQNFYSEIEGFEYEPGFLYKISVKEEQLDASDVPADGASIKYTLLKILEKTMDPKLQLNDIWVVISIEGEEVEPAGEGERRKDAQMEIQLAGSKVSGTDGCNNFTGTIELVSAEDIHFGPLASTRKMCMDMTLPDKFNRAISQVKKYKINNLRLTLLNEQGQTLMVLKKVD